MAEFPFQIVIESLKPAKDEKQVACISILRDMAGVRRVYDGVWNGRPVIIKVFEHKIKARYHLRREWDKLISLREKGVSCPEAFFYGRTKEGYAVMVIEKIADSVTALDVYNEAQTRQEKIEVLCRVIKEVAFEHAKGVFQRDLHLGNFLIQADKLFSIDPCQMKFRKKPISKNKGIGQVAAIAAFASSYTEVDELDIICEKYLSFRGFETTKADLVFFRHRLILSVKKGVSYGLKKFMRSSKRHLRLKMSDYKAIFDRNFIGSANTDDFVGQIDSLMDRGVILKNGNTCYVSRINFNGKEVVIKRYNSKGFFHSLRHTIKRSRARRGYLCGHRLNLLGIATPKPLAYIEICKYFLVCKSYLVTEFIEGVNYHDFQHYPSIADVDKKAIAEKIDKIFCELEEHLISHGDLKHSNILISKDGPVLTDLDSTIAHKCRLTFRRERKKDIARFLRG